MDVIQNVQRQQIFDLKDNLMHQLLIWKHPVGIHTLKVQAETSGLCVHYSNLDDAVNELIREEKIVLHFVGDVEIYLSATPSAASHFSTPKPKDDYGIPPFRRL